MEANTRVSVLMSVYVKEKPEYFSAAMESILAQTYPVDEIMIIEDDIVENYECTQDKIPLLQGLKDYSNKHITCFDVPGHVKNKGVKLLNKFFGDNNEIFLPVKVNYSIQYNLNTLMSISKIIEKSRTSIGEKYGSFNPEDNGYNIDPDKIKLAEKEMNNLMEIEEKVEIKTISLKDISDIQLSSAQMQSLLFMIEEE